ncbi:UvrD-helicase domain-containing protein [Pseudomonas sp. 10S4]|uniref:UvrD-helicase domain-containing protein n=1 Tax=Pseudomonas sp. 10S4 TaxID=3048583 RepID=UPI003A10223C
MIFSRDPSTCIVAGAGSGKSTTMVLRLLVLHKYLGIPKERIAVVTFTRESRKDFRRKLAEVFALWGVTLTEEVTGRIVRTFHSRILDFIRCSQPHAKVTAFEFSRSATPKTKRVTRSKMLSTSASPPNNST